MDVEVRTNTMTVDMDAQSITVEGRAGGWSASPGLKFTELLGYTMWGFIHVLYLVGWGNRLGTL